MCNKDCFNCKFKDCTDGSSDRNREYYLAHREERLEYQKNYRVKNKEAVSAYYKDYAKKYSRKEYFKQRYAAVKAQKQSAI